MEKQILTRQELYDLVWSQPMFTLSKEYNISDVGLRKICIRLNIPLPRSGHWQKLQFGKQIQQPSLPTNHIGDQEVTLTLRSADSKQEVGELTPLKLLQKEIEDQLKSKLVVPDRLTNPDKLVIATKNDLTSQKPDTWQYKGSVRCCKELNTRVTASNISRALRFWDTLIKALQDRGHSVQNRNSNTYAVVEEHSFKIQLREKMKREVVKGGRSERTIYNTTGILSFQLDSYPNKEWRDGKQPLENCISKIIAQLELLGDEWKQHKLKRQKEEEIRKEKERIQKEFEKRQESDLADFRETLNKSSRWHKATNLRSYINEVEARAASGNNLSGEVKAWLEWARKKADWYDPFTEKDDDLLNGIDKETLVVVKKTSYYSGQP